MRKTLIAFSLIVALIGQTSCTDDKGQEIKFENLKLIETKTELQVSYYTTDGDLIPASTPLAPNTEYELEIKSDVPASFKFRKTDGFNLVEEYSNLSDLSEKTRLRIKTTDEPNIDPFFSVFVVLKSEKGEYVKERAQLFLKSSLN